MIRSVPHSPGRYFGPTVQNIGCPLRRLVRVTGIAGFRNVEPISLAGYVASTEILAQFGPRGWKPELSHSQENAEYPSLPVQNSAG
jgi:hypothetical protein